MGDELIKVMSNERLEELKAENVNNPSVVTLIDGILATRKTEVEQEAIKVEFATKLEALFLTLPHPETIYNVYASWREVEVPDTSKPKVNVDIVKTGAVTDNDGNITTPAVMETVKRHPMVKVFKWDITTNYATPKASGTGQQSAKTTKRAITVYKRNGTTLESKGNFTNATKACEFLGLVVSGDSANRVLVNPVNGYITEVYTGTDFKA